MGKSVRTEGWNVERETVTLQVLIFSVIYILVKASKGTPTTTIQNRPAAPILMHLKNGLSAGRAVTSL
jgi:hypothetical protein